jgi:hypothetical protein
MEIEQVDTLAGQLHQLKLERDAVRNPKFTAVMDRATADLQETDILDGVPGVGDRALDFARPNLEGDVIRLSSLLTKGPTVVSFFRGRW